MATTVKDPMCRMDVDHATAAGKPEYKGQTYYFCFLGCKKSFDKDPGISVTVDTSIITRYSLQ
jgi:YHS domain-containing protein